MIILIFSIVIVLIVFSKAGECYFCGSRAVTQWSTFQTRAICDKCWCKGKNLKDKDSK